MIVTNVLLNHNHILSPRKSCFHRCTRVISKSVKRRLELNDRSGIQMSKSFQSLAVEVKVLEDLLVGNSMRKIKLKVSLVKEDGE